MTKPARPVPRPSPGRWPLNGGGSKPGNARYENWAAGTRDTRDTAGKASAELQRRGQAQPEPDRQPQPGDESQTVAGWWRELEADAQVLERAIARQHQAAIDAGAPWPPQRGPGPDSLSAPEPEPGSAPKTSPQDQSVPARHAQDDRAPRLDELLARAAQAVQCLAAQQAERQASSEYAARIEREAHTEPEAEQHTEAREGIEIEL